MPKQKPVEIGTTSEEKLTLFAGSQARFRANGKAVAAHHVLVDNPAFDAGAAVAMCQYAEDLSLEAVDLNTAASVGFRLRGAVDFLSRFKTLAEVPKPMKTLPPMNPLKDVGPYRRP